MWLLVEALEGNLKAVHSWAKRKDLPQNPNSVASRKSSAPALDPATAENTSSGSAHGTKVIARASEERGATSPPPPVTVLQNGVHRSASNSNSSTLSCSGRKMFADDNVVVLSDDDEG